MIGNTRFMESSFEISRSTCYRFLGGERGRFIIREESGLTMTRGSMSKDLPLDITLLVTRSIVFSLYIGRPCMSSV